MQPWSSQLIRKTGQGIGRGLSRLLVAKGHRVLLIDNNETELTHTISKLSSIVPASASSTSSAKPYSHILANLRHASDLDRIATHASTFFSHHLDVLINNAAYTSGAVGAAKITDDDFPANWVAAIETNLTAPALLSRACIPLLRKSSSRETGGCIIHMSSTRARQSEPHSEGYASSKAGLVGLTHSMAISLAELGTGIRVNTILPGWIHVEDERKQADEDGEQGRWPGTQWEDSGPMSKEDHEWHPAGRVGRVQDVLRAIEYLVEAGFVTGQEIVVDGGVGRKMVYPE